MEETRVLLANVGKINPASIEEYKAAGGFSGLEKALTMTQLEIIDEIKASNLRGRGGAGFPVSVKWMTTYDTVADQKYVVCNADEGEPGTNKDRVLMTGDPLSLIESMAITGYAVGATQGYIYLRAEYPYIMPVLKTAINNARESGYLGENIAGSTFDFDIKLVSGGGSYVCGEETALLESIEGRRGEPRFKPPYPGVCGLYGKPTVINNVETLVNVAIILRQGAEWFKNLGTKGSPGTKLFTICGNVKNGGVYEFPMGVSLKDLIYKVGGGVKNGNLLGVQLGGGSGAIINADQIDIELDINSIASRGISLGAGDIMVIDDTNDILAVVQSLLEFFAHESCGKCTPCREGTTRLLGLVKKIRDGEGTLSDLDNIRELSKTMMDSSFCGLGQASPIPVLSTLNNFYGAYLKAIERGRN
ncbi:MAG: NADH-quinone oxidoreductase subunit NuoF [Clostridiales bacterium]